MITSESIIVSKRPLGEADLLVTLFTKEGGKIKGVARHAKRSRKRFGGVLESGYIVNLHYVTSPKSDLVRIDQAALVTPRVYVEQSLGATYALWLALEFANRFLPDFEANREKYELLRRFIFTIHEKRLSRTILVFFLIKWISLCGYEPDFDHCAAELGFKLEERSLDVLKRVMTGDVNFDINDTTFEGLLKFVFHYSMILLGKPLGIETYLPMLMEI